MARSGGHRYCECYDHVATATLDEDRYVILLVIITAVVLQGVVSILNMFHNEFKVSKNQPLFAT